MSNQPLQVGDTVTVVNDYRPFLNGRQGVIVEILDGSAQVKVDHIGRSHEVTVYLKNLVKVEVTQ